MSAQSTLRTFSRARELGAEGYVLKHAPKAEVLKMLSDALDRIAEKSPGNPNPKPQTPNPKPQTPKHA